MTDRNVPTYTVTLTVADYRALHDALGCVNAMLGVVSHLRYGRPGELQQSKATLRTLLDRIEQQAA